MKTLRLRTALLAILVVFTVPGVFAKKGTIAKATTPFYQKSFSFAINGGVNYLPSQRMTTVPLFINPEITLVENVTLGVLVMHYQYKHYLQEDTTDYWTEWTEEGDDVTYTYTLFALKGSYHLTGLIAKAMNKESIKKYDLYASLLVGYNITSAKGTNATPDFEKETLRAGFAVGGRYIYSKNLGFFMEYGITSFAHGTVGISLIF